MAYTTINKSTDYFNTKLYTGNGSTQSITGVGFQPDWVWVKQRGGTTNHKTSDAVRGATKALQPNDVDAEATDSNGITSFDSDGFSLGNGGDYNSSSASQVAWNWLKSATAGFDIVSYTGNSSARTISHNCGAIPKMMLIKKRSDSDNWSVYHQGTGAGNYLILNTTSGSGASSTMWNNTTPTASVFSLGNKGEVNANGQTFIAYLFAEIPGYSKFGTYTGTGSDVFIYTGFKVGWLLVKNAENTNGWLIIDTKRSPANPQGKYHYANASSAEGTVTYGEFFSNGFGWKGTGSVAVNQSGEKFIYYAIAENPFVTSTGVPATAR